eukprot:4600656-Pleurochrysis_carterae.AAC.1
MIRNELECRRFKVCGRLAKRESSSWTKRRERVVETSSLARVADRRARRKVPDEDDAKDAAFKKGSKGSGRLGDDDAVVGGGPDGDELLDKLDGALVGLGVPEEQRRVGALGLEGGAARRGRALSTRSARSVGVTLAGRSWLEIRQLVNDRAKGGHLPSEAAAVPFSEKQKGRQRSCATSRSVGRADRGEALGEPTEAKRCEPTESGRKDRRS